MTVVGVTTAVVAPTPYTPPFKYVTSYAPAPSVTGAITKPISNNPSVPSGTSNADYAWAYLSAHMMSWPSYRYIYLLYIVLFVILLIYTLSHHLHLGSSAPGAAFSRWAIRRQPIGKRRSGGVRGRALPSNGVLLLSAVLIAVVAVLSFVGPDYIQPSGSVFSFAATRKRQLLFPGQTQYASPSYTISTSVWTLGSRLGDTAFALIPITVLFAIKSPPIAILAWRGLSHLYSDKLAVFHKVTAWLVWVATTAHVALWTVQLFMDKGNGRATWFAMWTNYRFIAGAAGYATMTALMVLSLRVVRQKQYEFFYISHIILVFLTIALSALHHPVLWFWMASALGLWALERTYRQIRFWRINGLSARSRTTLLARQYEDLPTSDIYAMTDLKTSYSQDKTLPRVPLSGGSRGDWSPASTPPPSAGLDHGEFGKGQGRDGYYDDGSLQPLGTYEQRYSSDQGRAYHEGKVGGFVDPYESNSRDSLEMSKRQRKVSDHVGQNRLSTFSQATTLTHNPPPAPVAIPPGFALAQLLPSRTVRLTIRLPRPFRWSPGQSVLLSLPELSKIQSHPFSISNTPSPSGEIVLLVKSRKGLTRQLYNSVRSRYLASFPSVSDGARRHSGIEQPIMVRAKLDGPFGSSARVNWGRYSTVVIICGGSGVSFGVCILEAVCKGIQKGDGGRVGRVRFCWVAREYAEIAWVAHQIQRCRAIVDPSKLQIEIYITNTTPLSHSRLGRPSTIASYAQPSPSSEDLAPPRAAFTKHPTPSRSSSAESSQTLTRRSTSMDSIASIASDLSVDQPQGYSDGEEVDQHLNDSYADIIDLTNYEDEEDVYDPEEGKLSGRLREQGKIRRAKSRRDAKRNQGPRRGSALVPQADEPRDQRFRQGMPVSGSRSSGLSVEGGMGMAKSPSGEVNYPGQARNQHLAPRSRSQAALSAYDQLAPADPNSFGAPRPSSGYRTPSGHRPAYFDGHTRRHSNLSYAESTYGAYDPFNSNPYSQPGAYSPAPSIRYHEDDTGSVAGDSVRPFYPGSGPASGLRNSRTGSMVLMDEYDLAPIIPSNGQREKGVGRGGKTRDKDREMGQGLWVDMADYEAMVALSELAITGRPALGKVLDEEVKRAQGRMIVTTCGPTTLNTVVRNLVSKHIRPGRGRDGQGKIEIYSEDYDG